MPEAIKFSFDPICPWSYQTSRWARRLEELGQVVLDWGVFSLAIANAEGGDLTEDERQEKQHARSARALRTAVLVREHEGQAAVGRFYASIGARVHERGEAIDDPKVVAGALADARLDPELGEQAMADEETAKQLESEHRELVSRTRSFGVPTITLDGGDGPSIFGPVISELPSDEDAVELLRHVVWLARCENFSELKRDRTIDPPLESVRQWRARTEAGLT